MVSTLKRGFGSRRVRRRMGRWAGDGDRASAVTRAEDHARSRRSILFLVALSGFRSKLVDRAGIEPATRCLQGSAAPQRPARDVESAGIEPASPRCERGVLPLDDDPVGPSGIEPESTAHEAAALPLSYEPVRAAGFEPAVFGMSGRRSTADLRALGGATGIRTRISSMPSWRPTLGRWSRSASAWSRTTISWASTRRSYRMSYQGMAPPTRIELAHSALTGQRSRQGTSEALGDGCDPKASVQRKNSP